MRTFHSSLCVGAIAAALITPAVSGAQRNVRRSTRQAGVATSARSARHRGDYSLAVVSALLPSETPGVTSDVVTLVIENRGTESAPASVISVAPKDHLTLARWSSIPALAPGQRAAVQLPVEIGPDGTPCISITITTAPAVAPAASFLAAAMPDPMPSSAFGDGWRNPDPWSAFPRFADPGFFGGLGPAGDW